MLVASMNGTTKMEEVFASDGPPLGDDEDLLDGGDEEVFASDSNAAASDSFDDVLAELEVLMMDESLNDHLDEFQRANCGVFERDDENKLEYTTIFNQYTAMVEAFLEERLGASVASFDMGSFCAQLTERAQKDPELLDQPALESLFAYSDFDAFKEMMLSAKEGLSIEADSGLMLVAGEKLGLSGVGGGDADGGADVGEGGDEDVGTLAPELDNALMITGVSPSK